MAISCETNDLLAVASCMQCLEPVQHLMVQTYLLALIAGASTDPNVLIELAKGFQRVPPAVLQQIEVYLLCQIADAAGA